MAILTIDTTNDSVLYKDINQNFATGDVLLVHFTDTFSLDLEQRTNSVFAHAGMIVMMPEMGVSEPLLWHSAPGGHIGEVFLPPTLYNSVSEIVRIQALYSDTNSSDTSDITSDNLKSQETNQQTPEEKEITAFSHSVKLIRLSVFLQRMVALKNRQDEYKNDAAFAYRKLKFPSLLDNQTILNQSLAEFIRMMDGAAFPYPESTLFTEYEQGKLGVLNTSATFFCSELVAATYQHLGLLPPTPPANAYMPVEFSSQNTSLNLLQNAELAPEVWFQFDGDS